MKISRLLGAVCGCLASLVTFSSHAATILSPIDVTIIDGDDGRSLPGLGVWYKTGMYNQRGLTAQYISGVTDFDTYVALNPVQENPGNGNNYFWWSASQPDTAYNPGSVVVTLDLGDIYLVDRILWIDTRGFGAATLSTSIDGTNFSPLSLLSGSSPTSGVTSFPSANAQYIRLDAGCSVNMNGCRIGEVAFSVSAVPIPPAIWLFGSGLIGLIGMARRKKAD